MSPAVFSLSVLQGGEDYLQGLAARYAQELGVDRGIVARQLAELQLCQLQQLPHPRPPGSPTSASSGHNIYATIGSAGGGVAGAAAGVPNGVLHTYANVRSGRSYQPGSYAVW